MYASTPARVSGLERETDMRKPLTALPATHRVPPPCGGPTARTARRQQRCCGSMGQRNKKPACLLPAPCKHIGHMPITMPTPTTMAPFRPSDALLASVSKYMHARTNRCPLIGRACQQASSLRVLVGESHLCERASERDLVGWVV